MPNTISSIPDIPDASVVRIESFVGVVAKDEWAAVDAARQLKADWTSAQLGSRNERRKGGQAFRIMRLRTATYDA
jgi:hypothetical protein